MSRCAVILKTILITVIFQRFTWRCVAMTHCLTHLPIVWSLIESWQSIGWWCGIYGCRPRHSYIAICIFLPSLSGHISPSVAVFLAPIFGQFFSLSFLICTSATAIVERCSPRGGLHGFSSPPAAVFSLQSWATTCMVSVLTLCLGFHKRAMRFTDAGSSKCIFYSSSVFPRCAPEAD